MIDANYKLLILKLSYFMETFVFIIGGKFHLITVYIVFHHTTLPLCVWLSLNYNPGGPFLLVAVINLVTHLILMAYLITTQLWPSLKNSWTKSVVVKAHIVQFSIMLLYGCYLFVDNPCKYPMSLIYFAFVWGAVTCFLYVKGQKKNKMNS